MLKLNFSLRRKQDEYHLNLKQAEEKQINAQNKREVGLLFAFSSKVKLEFFLFQKLQDSLNAKSRKQVEIRQLLNDSSTKLPDLETGKRQIQNCGNLFDILAIEKLRLERQQISDLLNETKSPRRSTILQDKPLPSPVQSFQSLEQDT